MLVVFLLATLVVLIFLVLLFPAKAVSGQVETSANKAPKEVVVPRIAPKPNTITETIIAQKYVPPLAPKPQPAVTGNCQEWIAAAGVTDTVNAYKLIMAESGCNPGARNPSSGACGIPQANPCSKLGTSDPVAQIVWMQNYVFARYGSWANAWTTFLSRSPHWY